MVAVQGSYDDVNKLASELADEREDWAFVNVNVRPYYAEGSKTIGFEIAEQLGWRLPEQIVVPVASGAQLVKIDKAFRELAELGLVPDTGWKVFGAQAAGCSPVTAAFEAGHDVVQPVRPDTLAKSLAIGNPADGPYVLDVVRRTGGALAAVTDDEMVDAIRLLAATEGIFAETAGGVTLASLRKLVDSGQLDPDAETVIINSGDGLKTLDAVAPGLPALTPIRPSLAEFAALEAAAAQQGRAGGPGMSVSVRVPTILRAYTGGAAEVATDPGSLRDVLARLDEAYPGLAGRILDDTGKLRRFVNVYVGDEDVRLAQGLDTPVPAGVQVSVIPAVAGG